MSQLTGLEVAIVAMAGRFPGAGDVDELWRRLREGESMIQRFSDEELEASGVPPEVYRAPGYVPAAGVIDDEDRFDAAFFDYTPREAEAMDPQHRIFLELCWEALERAGYAPGEGSPPVGVYAGAAISGYLLHNLLGNPEVERALGSFQLSIGSEQAYLAPRVSYKLDLAGPSVSVNTACSTSLVAVHLACQGLLNGECDLALAGGSALHIPHRAGYLYEPGGIDSPDGFCRPFDARAEGTVSGGGAGVVVLKRLADARDDGDRILAVIRGSAVNNDAGRRLGFTAPGPEGQAAVIRMAQTVAEVEPSTVSFIETHGTATKLGDQVEIAALKKAFGGEEVPPGSCRLGAVKSNIGHLGEASGVAGLIKTVLALVHGQIPPNHDFRQSAPDLELEDSPFRVSGELVPWPENGGGPRRAGVSSFGIGGTNAHVVLEEAPPVEAREAAETGRSRKLLVLSARSESALETATDRLADCLGGLDDETADATLADAAYTLQHGRKAFSHRRVVVCGDAGEAARLLRERDPRRVLGGVRETSNRPVAFVFSGLGDQYPDMALDLYREEPVFREVLDRCAEILEPHLGLDVRKALFPEGTKNPRKTAEGAGPSLRSMLGRGSGGDTETDDAGNAASRELARTEVAQPTLFAVEYALAQTLIAWGVKPQALVGYSLGEYTAAAVAGVLELDDALELVALRARLVEAEAAGAMTTVALPAEEVETRLGDDLSISAINAPEVTVVAGPVAAVEALESRLDEEGGFHRRLRTSHAFHWKGLAPLGERLTELVKRFTLHPPEIPYLSNVTGTWITDEEATDPGYWARHLVQPVRFARAVEELWREPDRILLELGPGQGLSSLALQQLPDEPGERTALPTLPGVHDGVDDVTALLTTVGKLWLEGVRIDWSGFSAHEPGRRVPLPTYPFERKRFWIDPPRRGRRAAEGAGPAAVETGPGEAHATGAAGEAGETGKTLELHDRPNLKTTYVEPRNPTEERIAVVWRELLGIDRVGVFDSFFELGGHSLLGTQLVARLRRTFGVEVPLESLFRDPTVSGLAAKVPSEGEVSVAALPSPEPSDEEGPSPPSYGQERLWFLDRLQPGTAAYHIPGAFRLQGSLTWNALQDAVTEILRRHEVLRSRLVEIDDVPRQEVLPATRVRIPRVDLGGLSPADRERSSERLIRAEAQAPFVLAEGPMARFRALDLDAADSGEHAFLVTLHHVAGDGWSMGLFVREVTALYGAFAEGRPSGLDALPLQYADFARWQTAWLQGDVLEAELAHWRDALEGASQVLELPTDRPRPAEPSHRGDTVQRRWPGAWSSGLTEQSRTRGATLFMALATVVAGLLTRIAGQREVLLGTPVAGRRFQDLEDLIGFFVNTLVLRVDAHGTPSFGELLERVRSTTLAAYDHQDMPFERLVDALATARDNSRSPLFQAMVSLQNTPNEEAHVGGVALSVLPTDTASAQFDLALAFEEEGDELILSFNYATDLFDRSTVERWSRQLETLTAAALEHPDAPLGELPWTTPAQRWQVVGEWSDTALVLPYDAPLPKLLRARAEQSPERPALAFRDEELTYGELFDRVAVLARRLAGRGVGPETRVGVLLERSVDMVVAVLAVMEAGGAYVPLDPSHPEARLAYVASDSGISVLVAGTDVDTGSIAPEVPVLWVGAEDHREHSQAEPAAPGLHNLAYVLYTSGSTGRPKGVEISHGALVNFLASMARRPGLTEDDVLLAVTTLGFDIAGLELYLPLLVGARLVVAPTETAADGGALLDLLNVSGATVLQATPATWRMLLAAGWEDGKGLEALCGGEALPRELADRILDTGAELWNVYGPTETTVWSSVSRVASGAGSGRISLGRPIANTRIVVVDRHGEPTPPGIPGELLIGGDGLARGYHGLPVKTASAFVPDPRSTGGERLYRTGDLARHRPDGTLEYLGRLDHQVKVRGFRIELGEIEEALRGHGHVHEAAVLALGEDDRRRLVAYVVMEPDAADTDRSDRDLARELTGYVKDRLPTYMVPSHVVRVDDFPLTPSGKLDRRALARIEPSGPSSDAAVEGFVPPAGAVEELVAEIWAQVLELDAVDAHTSFVELGGHSLLATRIVARVRRAFGIDLALADLFDEPTVAGLARRVEAARTSGEAGGLPPLEPAGDAERDHPAPLSFAQERLWFVHQLEPDSPAYGMPFALELEGRLAPAALADALGELVRRHEILRTVFSMDDDSWAVQRGEPARPRVLPLVDLTVLEPEQRLREARRLADAEAARPWSLTEGPLLRSRMLTLETGERSVLLLSKHHIVSDGWSVDVLVRELGALYAVTCDGRPSPLAPLPVQYADFARWQRSWLDGELLDREMGYWRDHLAGVPRHLDLPTDRPRPRTPSGAGGSCSRELATHVSEGLRRLGRRRGTTPFMTFLAAFEMLLYRLSGQRDFAVGTPVAGREQPEVAGLIGFFVNTLALRSDLDRDPSFDELLGRVRDTVLGGLAHQDVPFERLVREIVQERDVGRMPLVQTMFLAQERTPASVRLPQLEMRPFEPTEQDALPLELALSRADQMDLILYVTWTGVEHAEAMLEYSADLFDEATVERMLRHFETLLAAALETPDRRVSELPLTTPEERDQMLAWSRGAAPDPEPVEPVLDRFEGQAARRSEAKAVLADDGTPWTYGELDARARVLARRLLKLGVEPESRVAVLLSRRPDAVAAILAIWKAGGVYVPLDAASPDERLRRILEDSAARVLMADGDAGDGADDPLGSGLDVLRVDQVPADTEEADEVDEADGSARLVDPIQAAYVLYTSGSTGRVKGVVVSHDSLARHLTHCGDHLEIREDDRVLAFASTAFDVSLEQIFAPLAVGATVCLRGDDLWAPERLAEVVDAGELTVLDLTPAYWKAFLETCEARDAPPSWESVRRISVGGESLPPETVELWRRVGSPEVPLVNAYGPTEATITATVHPVVAGGPIPPRMPIGRPLPGRRAHVLGPDGEPTPVGVPGELVLGGEGVTRGYLDRPARTAGVFVPDPFGDEPGARLYRTGDRARVLPDGHLEFLGRLDYQVKIRGFRLELGEVEAALAELSGIREAAVGVEDDEVRGRSLVAYLVPTTPDDLDVEELHGELARQLPDYMMPSAVVVLDALPRTPSGKVDRPALDGLEAVRLGDREPYVAPRTDLERELVELWADLLDVDTDAIGVHDDFFRRGGHSLMATQLVSRIRKRLDVDLSLAEVFGRATVADLAEMVETARWARGAADATTAEDVGDAEDLEYEEIEL